MITEFIGVSGVGKTTKAKDYFDKRRDSGRIRYPLYDLYSNKKWLSRNIYKLVRIITFSISNLIWVKEYYKFLIRIGLSKRVSIVPLFNGIFLKSIRFKADNDVENIFDEGVYQYLWGLVLRSPQKINKNIVLQMEMFFGAPDKLIVVTSSSSKIKERLLKRGEYCKIMDSNNILGKVSEMQDVVLEIIKCVDANVSVEYLDN